jgi:hypothetical protein
VDGIINTDISILNAQRRAARPDNDTLLFRFRTGDKAEPSIDKGEAYRAAPFFPAVEFQRGIFGDFYHRSAGNKLDFRKRSRSGLEHIPLDEEQSLVGKAFRPVGMPPAIGRNGKIIPFGIENLSPERFLGGSVDGEEEQNPGNPQTKAACPTGIPIFHKITILQDTSQDNGQLRD